MMFLASFLALLSAVPALSQQASSLLNPPDSAVGVLWTFPNVTWIENLAIREGGEVLATSINRAALYSVNPFSHVTTTVHQFDASDGLLGITEVTPDVFAVASSNVSVTTGAAQAGSSKLWKVDLTGADPAISLIANLTNVTTPGGMTALDRTQDVVLLADPPKGIIWRIDTQTGDYEVAIQDPALVSTSKMIPLGVHGIHISNGYLYFSNLGSNALSRVPISACGSARGPVEPIAILTLPDDFAVTNDGTAYVAGANSLYRVSLNGTVNTLVGGPDDTTLVGATSAQLGRTYADQNVVYIGTNGGLQAPINGIHGGQILAVNVGLFS